MQPYQSSSFEWPAVLACLALFAVAVLCFTGCSLETSVIGHRTDQQPVITIPHASAPDDDAGEHLRAESIWCSVAQMQNWVLYNYPYSYGWVDTFTGNNGKAHLTASSCSYYERQFIAPGNCSNSSCAYDMKNCDGSCQVGGCAHYRTLTCRCGDVNGCEVSP